MHADSYPTAVYVPTDQHGGFCLKTPVGDRLVLDQEAKLEKGCTVAVFMNGYFLLVGRILRRPVSTRRLLIGHQDASGNNRTTRYWGLKERKGFEVQVWRVVGSFTSVPF